MQGRRIGSQLAAMRPRARVSYVCTGELGMDNLHASPGFTLLHEGTVEHASSAQGSWGWTYCAGAKHVPCKLQCGHKAHTDLCVLQCVKH
eukprot:82947-Chlamydomonas_euryale.AAC.3